MKIYITLSSIVSTLFGLLPILIAKTTDQGEELCDPDLFYAPERSCDLLWQPTLLAFALYFAIAFAFFMVVAVVLKTIFWLLRRNGSR